MGGPGSGRNAGGGGGAGSEDAKGSTGSQGKPSLGTNKDKGYNKQFTRSGYVKGATKTKQVFKRL